MFNILRLLFHNIIDMTLTTGCIPSELKHAMITPI